MKFTIDWLKQHLDTKYNDAKIINICFRPSLNQDHYDLQLSY